MKNNSYIRTISFSHFAPFQGEKNIFSELAVELTERCNNNCLHCYINKPANDAVASNQEMSFDIIQKILEEAACLGCLHIRLTGGEPLLRDDFEDIYLYAKKIGYKIKIFTNGTRITPQLAQMFKKIPPGESIQVSLYGYNRKTYETISGVPGSFRAAQRGLDQLIAHKVPFVVNAVALPMTIAAFKKFECLAQSFPDLNMLAPQVTSLQLRCRGWDDLRNERIKSLRLSAQAQLDLEARESESYFNGLKNFCLQFCHVSGDTLFRCNAGLSRASVDAYGTLQPCLLLRHPEAVYNLKKGSLTDAFQNFFPKMRQLKAKNSLYLERCACCFLIALCEQCPAVSWMENQTMDGWPEHFCSFTHAQARCIGLLSEGEKAWMVTDWKERIKGLCGTKPLDIKKHKTTKPLSANVSVL